MRRALCMLLVMAACMAVSQAMAADSRYDAVVAVAFQLRAEPREDARRLLKANKGSPVEVQAYGEDWCRIAFGGKAGYAKTAWLSKFRALDPMAHEVPGRLYEAGIVKVEEAMRLMVPGYDGNALSPGDVLAVSRFEAGKAVIHMMRDTATVPARGLAFTPFVPWQNAREGDLLYAFTTFFNEGTGGRLAGNRAFNITLASQRLVRSAASLPCANGRIRAFFRGGG